MQNFQIKTIQIRDCRRCKTTWAAEAITLEVEDQVNFVRVTIAHCPACSESFAAEIDRPTYRRTGKRVK